MKFTHPATQNVEAFGQLGLESPVQSVGFVGLFVPLAVVERILHKQKFWKGPQSLHLPGEALARNRERFDRTRVTHRLDHVKSGELKFTSQTRIGPSVLVRNVTNG